MEKQRIIYICGLGHSGSTLLDMSLATLPGVVGLGELYTLLNEEDRERHFNSHCSCGKSATECEFWASFPARINNTDKIHDKYQSALDYFAEKYGSNAVLVDSSKNSYAYLQYLKQTHKLTVIYLTRDFRSWSHSRHLSTGKSYFYFLIRWKLENLKLLNRLKKMQIEILKIGYEELSLYPDHIFKQICEYAGLEYSEQMLSPENSKSHIISGNIARVDKEKRSRWIYDARWFLSRRVLFWGLFSLINMRMNKRLVYSNIWKGRMKDFHLFGTEHKKQMSRKYN